MDIRSYLPGILCIASALGVMVCLMHYARFYGPSYFFWIGAILAFLGLISLIKPLAFLFILNRTIAAFVFGSGLSIAAVALFWPVHITQAQTGQSIDLFAPEYTFNEYHERIINASPETVKEAFCKTGVGDIPVVHLLLKIRGIADEKIPSDIASKTTADNGILRTPDFDWFVVDSVECITYMLINASGKTPPPVLPTLEAFSVFNEPGFIKTTVNFRFAPLANGQTRVSTETRNYAQSSSDNRIFGRYWRIIYPGSALIRRVWLDTLAKKAEQNERQKANTPNTSIN